MAIISLLPPSVTLGPLAGPYASGLAVALLLAAVASVLYVYRRVRWHRLVEYAQIPQPKPSLLWGHLKVLHETIKAGHPRRHHDYAFREIWQQMGRPPFIFIDLRPFSYPMAVICDHEVAEQFTRASKQFPWSTPKSPGSKDLKDLLGDESMLTHEGEAWKALRRRFNPGFAPKHLLSLLPCILEKTQPYMDKLERLAADGQEFEYGNLTTALTFDIIGAVVMDADLAAQTDGLNRNGIVNAFRRLADAYADPASPGLDLIFLRQRFRRWRLGQNLDRLLEDHIRKTFASMHQEQPAGRSRSVLGLSLESLDSLDDKTMAQTCASLKTFLFAGHDTTSITLQWAIYELSRTPRALAALRAELDHVFGPDTDPTVVRQRLLAPGGEELLSRLPYTSAVMKETLRLYPPAGSARYIPGGSNFHPVMPGPQAANQSPCLDGCVIYICHTIIQRDPAVYGDNADLFYPERWLGNTDTSEAAGKDLASVDDSKQQQQQQQRQQHDIPPSAWRPFERGQRNCIGQELANIETRIILACTVRRFDFEKVGLGETLKDESGNPVMGPNDQYKTVSELYNISKVTGQPIDNCRMKVKLTAKAQSVA